MGRQNLISIAVGTVLTVGGIMTSNPSLAWAGASMVVGGLANAAFGKPRGLNQKQGWLLSNPSDPAAQHYITYGETLVGLTLADERAPGAAGGVLYVVGAIGVASQAGGGIEDVIRINFDDRTAVDNPDLSGTLVTTGVQAPWDTGARLQYAVHTGTDAQTVNAALNSSLATQWPTTSKGAGIAYTVLRLTFDPEVYSGVPNVTALVKGQKVFDPRSSLTAWSDNPALCIRDYLTSSKYGCAVPTSELDDQSFIDAANYCDELVNTTAVNQKRFTCNGALDTAQLLQDNLAELLSCCRGELVYQSGKFRLVIRKPTTATTFALTEDNIVGDWEFIRAGSSVPNSVTARFIDASWGYMAREVTWPQANQANAFLTADNNHLSTTQIDLPFTADYYRAQQIAMTTLREQREDLTVVVTAKQEALKLQVGDVVPFTHSTPGFSAKPFWVVAVGILPDARVRLVLREYDVAAYTLDTQTTDPTPTGSGLPNPFTVTAPTSLVLTADSTTALDTQGGQPVPRIKVDWTASTHPFVQRYDVEFKRTADAVWTPVASTLPDETETYIWPVTEGVAYDVRTRAVNTIGVSSAWRSGSVTVATKAGTPEVSSVSVTWDEVLDLARIVVKGGVYIGSVTIDMDDDSAFGSPVGTSTDNVSEGGTVTHTISLATLGGASARNKEWFARARPFSGAAGTGTAGREARAQTRVEGNVTKTGKVAASSFFAGVGSIGWTLASGYLSPDATGELYIGEAALELAGGVLLTGFSARLYRASSTDDTAAIKLFEQTDSGATQVGSSGFHSGTGWSTVTVSITETDTTGKSYFIRVELQSVSGLGDDARLAWGAFDYKMPTLDNTR